MEIGSGSNKMKVQNKKRKSKLEFLGWGSKRLIEFLDSIGKESRQYSQGEVDAIMKKYIQQTREESCVMKNLRSCEKLEKLFKKKTVLRKNVYHLLEVHFRENHDDDVDNAPALRN
nr:GYF-like protein [Ipomoea batatas]